MKIVEKVKELVEPIAEAHKYFIVDITYRREGGGRFILRIVVDKDGGITMDECARLNNDLSELFDKENIVDDRYILEVSSPGLDRKLKSDRDFMWAVGKRVRITTFEPLEGKKIFVGTLLGITDDSIVVEEGGISTQIQRDKIANAKLEYGIDWSGV